MKGKIIDYMEMAQGARYGIEKESDRLTERLTQMEDYRKLLDGIDEVIADNKRQQEEIESLQQQLTEEKRQRAELEMKLTELNKLTAGTLPDDMADTIDNLDDEQTEPKVVNVAGNYNDIHDNKNVNLK